MPASVQGDLSCLEYFPVLLLERTVSLELANSIFSLTIGFVSASDVVSQTDPHQAPDAPIDIAAAI